MAHFYQGEKKFWTLDHEDRETAQVLFYEEVL